MKIKDIAAKYNLDQNNFQWWVENNKGFKKNLLSTAIEDTDVEKAVEMYRAFKEKDDAEKAATQRALDAAKKKEQERQQAIASVLITSGFNFDGYKITKYSGYISGDDARQIDRDHLFDNRGQALTDTLVLLRTQALKELKEAAYDLGCNAVIGVDFDYLTFEPETINGTVHYYQPYVVCVTANGNAVIIEKD